MNKTDIFITKATNIHNNLYDYSNVDYKNNETKVKIICKEHGEFEQSPKNHLDGRGCAKCGVNKTKKAQTLSNDEFIKKAQDIHDDIYDYSKVNYINYNTKVTIICKKHGNFDQTPKNHLDNQGCPTCGNGSKITTDDYIVRSKEIYGDLYDYSDTNYINSRTNLTITCKIHGKFTKRPLLHLKSNGGCPECIKKNDFFIIIIN